MGREGIYTEGGAQKKGLSTHEMKGMELRGLKGNTCDVTASNPRPG